MLLDDHNSWLPRQRLERENDLIAAHILLMRELPVAQFLGIRKALK